MVKLVAYGPSAGWLSAALRVGYLTCLEGLCGSWGLAYAAACTGQSIRYAGRVPAQHQYGALSPKKAGSADAHLALELMGGRRLVALVPSALAPPWPLLAAAVAARSCALHRC